MKQGQQPRDLHENGTRSSSQPAKPSSSPLHERRQRPRPLLAASQKLREVPTHQHRRVALVGLTRHVADRLITSDARDLILRVSRGIPRLISHLLRISLVLADERGLSSIDASVVNTAAIVLYLEATRPAVTPSPKPRFDRDSRSRG